MKIPLAVLADAANVSEGKLNILGNFSIIYAKKFPARHPSLQLVVRMEASPAESGSTKNMEVVMMDADGKKIMGFRADFPVPGPANPGENIQIQTILNLQDTIFPTAGRYAISILLNGQEEASIPLTLTLQEGG